MTYALALEELKIQSETVSLEALAIGELYSDITRRFKEKLPFIANSFRSTVSFFNGAGSERIDNAKLSKKQKEILETISKYRYDEMVQSVMVPQGLKCTYKHYLETLLPVTQKLRGLQSDVIQPYMLFLAQLVSAKDATLIHDSYARQYEQLQKLRDQYSKELGQCFYTGSNNVNVKYFDAFERNSDWQDVFYLLSKCTENINSVNRGLIQSTVKQCSDYIDIIVEDLSAHPEKQVAQEAAMRLAVGAYQVAREIEFYSTTHFRLLTIHGQLENTMDKLLRLL